jgi:hypothetical protein
VFGVSVFFEATVIFPTGEKAQGHPVAKVVLTNVDGGVHHAYVDRNGRVMLPGLTDGSYVMDVAAIGFMFHQYRLDIQSGSAYPASLSIISTRTPLPAPWKLVPLGQANYYQQRSPFSIRSILLSPYGLMGSMSFCQACCL